RIRWEWHVFRRAQALEPRRRAAKLRLEAADTQARQPSLHAVDNAGPLTNQALALATWALGILLIESRDRHHAAVTAFSAKPAEKDALEHRSIEPIGLCASMFPRDCHAGRMDHMNLNPSCAQPSRQPKPVPP